MPDILSAMREFRSLDDKRRAAGLSSAEEQRWQELRTALKGPGHAAPKRNEAVHPVAVAPTAAPWSPPPTSPALPDPAPASTPAPVVRPAAAQVVRPASPVPLPAPAATPPARQEVPSPEAHPGAEIAAVEEPSPAAAGSVDPTPEAGPAVAPLEVELPEEIAAAPAEIAPDPADPTPDEPRGYELDAGSGYLWHPVARHWFDPATGVYFDVDGNGIDAADARASASPPPPAPEPEPIELDLPGDPSDRVELASQVEFLEAAARVNDRGEIAPVEALALEEEPEQALEVTSAAEFLGRAAEESGGGGAAGPAEWDPDAPDPAAWAPGWESRPEPDGTLAASSEAPGEPPLAVPVDPGTTVSLRAPHLPQDPPTDEWRAPVPEDPGATLSLRAPKLGEVPVASDAPYPGEAAETGSWRAPEDPGQTQSWAAPVVAPPAGPGATTSWRAPAWTEMPETDDRGPDAGGPPRAADEVYIPPTTSWRTPAAAEAASSDAPTAGPAGAWEPPGTASAEEAWEAPEPAAPTGSWQADDAPATWEPEATGAPDVSAELAATWQDRPAQGGAPAAGGASWDVQETPAAASPDAQPAAASWEAQPAPAAASWEAQPAPAAASWEAQPAPAAASWKAQPAPEAASWGAQPAPEAASWEAQPAPVAASWEAQATPVAASWEAQATPEAVTWEAPPAPAAASWEAQPAPEAVSWDAQPAPEAASWEAQPAPEAASWEAPPAPAAASWDAQPAPAAVAWDAQPAPEAASWEPPESAAREEPSPHAAAASWDAATTGWQEPAPAAGIPAAAPHGASGAPWEPEVAAVSPEIPPATVADAGESWEIAEDPGVAVELDPIEEVEPAWEPGPAVPSAAPPQPAWNAAPEGEDIPWEPDVSAPDVRAPAPEIPEPATPPRGHTLEDRTDPTMQTGGAPWDDEPTAPVNLTAADASAWTFPERTQPAAADEVELIDSDEVTSLDDSPPAADDLDLDVAVEQPPAPPLSLPPGTDDFDLYAPAVVPDPVTLAPTLLPDPTPLPTPLRDPPPAPVSPGHVAGRHRVVVHTREGLVRRGEIADVDLAGEEIGLHTGERAERMLTSAIKAVFFMLPPGQQAPPPSGNKVRITFQDGRMLPGFVTDLQADPRGFFLLPADTRTNTARIYVYRDAVREIARG